MSQMDQDRIIEKIKKCLEMAKGKGANANEADTAMRQAQKMMQAYNLEMGDVLASMACEDKVPAGSEGTPPAWRVRLAQVCGEAFGSFMIITTSWSEPAAFKFIGCGAAPTLSGYSYQVLERQLQKARKDYLSTQKRCKRATKVARGDAFAHGWIDAVYMKVRDLAGVEDNIAEAIQAYVGKHYPDLGETRLKRRKLKSRDEGAIGAGRQAGKDAQLHRGLGNEPQARLTHDSSGT